MTAAVLLSNREIDAARDALRRMGASCIAPWPIPFFRRLGILGGVSLGDRLKSWDILTTATFTKERLPREAPILDIGAYASEILCVLHCLGYHSLTGIDLNPRVRKMPYADAIRYEVADFMRAPFGDGSFDAITAISVIEHGFDAPPLLGEISRLLRPGGYFVASFDYWPEKIDTAGMKIFGMNWTIFSREEVLEFVSKAKGYCLEPVGDILLDAGDRVIHWGGKEYTFGWIALQKKA
jgi:SAM-dependent methyltransferase